jgi:hypothetical protein
MTTSLEPLSEQIIGYDAREWWLEFDQTWTEERKQMFLFRLDVQKPLSVDSRVWHSIVDPQKADILGRIGFATTWEDLEDCRRAIPQVFEGKPMRPYKLISIIRVAQPGDLSDGVDWSSWVRLANPHTRASSWRLLGYDVADKWLLSGLSNCGLLPEYEDVVALRAEWGPMLNEWHLFTKIEEAAAFKQLSDHRMADDHAPFFVFGLWLVE